MTLLARKIGIDLGSSRTIIIVPKKGVVLNQPSIVARDQETQKIVATGDAALEMAEKTPESIKTEFPLRRGVIADFGATSKMLRSFLSQSTGRFHVVKPELMMSVSMTATSTEQRAVIDAGEAAGAQNVHLIQPPVAAALGAHVSITEPQGNMIIDIGAGTTEIAIMSLGGIVSKRAVRIGSRTINDIIISSLRRNYGIVIGQKTAENIKLTIGRVGSTNDVQRIEVSGRSTVEGLPKTIFLKNQDTQSMITPVFDELIRVIRSCIEQTPPELVSDIKKGGILLSGGGAKLTGLEAFLTERLNTSCSLIESPQLAVAKGTQIALTHLEDYKKSLLTV